jgi:hypothetical protein
MSFSPCNLSTLRPCRQRGVVSVLSEPSRYPILFRPECYPYKDVMRATARQ